MKPSNKHITSTIAILGSLILIFCVFKTRELYFSKTKDPIEIIIPEKNNLPGELSLTLPKLKVFKNEKLKPKKINLNESAEESLDIAATFSDQQILTNKYMIKVLSQQQNFLRRCFENHLRANAAPIEKGTIVVEFMVLPFGEIRDVEIKDSSFNDKTFENCIKTVFLRTQVKKFSGEKFLITFPLEFE